MRLNSSVPRVVALVVALFLLEVAYRLLAAQAPLNDRTLGLSALDGALLGLVLAWLAPRLDLRWSHLVAVLFLALFVIEFVSVMLEGYFFSTLIPSFWHLLAGLPVAAGFTLGQAIAAGFLLPIPTGGPTIRDIYARHFATRPTASWAWRITASSALFLPIYFLFGALVGPFVIAYYQEANLGLVLPPFTVIIPLELGRGLLYVVALLPVLAALRGDRWTPFLAIVLILYIPGSVVPLLTRVTVPAAIIPYHSLELLGDSIVYGFALTRLLKRAKGAEVAAARPGAAPGS